MFISCVSVVSATTLVWESDDNLQETACSSFQHMACRIELGPSDFTTLSNLINPGHLEPNKNKSKSFVVP